MLCDLKIITLCLYLYLTQYPNYYRIIFFYNFSIGTPSGIYGCLNALVRLFSTETIRKGGGGILVVTGFCDLILYNMPCGGAAID